MGCLLLYASCVGVLASRKSALAGARHLAGVALVGQDQPDVRTSSDVRPLPLEAVKDGWVPVGRLAAAAGGVPWGNGADRGDAHPGPGVAAPGHE